MVGIVIVIASILISAVAPFDKLPGFMGQGFHEGGWGMRPIMFAFLVSIWLAIDRVIVLVRSSFDGRTFMERLRGLLDSGNITGAVQLCQREDKPVTRVIGAGLAKSDQGPEEVLGAMDQAAYCELPEIEKRTGYLALLGNVATLMGLFGTIVGLIKSFAGVAGEAAGEKATLLAAGISEAMNCTAFGLMTGILALFAFSVINGTTQALIDEINHLTIWSFRIWKRSISRGKPVASEFVVKPIISPSSHLMTHVGLLAGGGHGRAKKKTFASLLLTPLIDMFIVLVIFLLITFSATGDILFVTKDIKLPFAEKVDKLERAPVVAISFPKGDPLGGVVTLEMNDVCTARELMEDESPDWKISKLTSQLEVMKNRWTQTMGGKPFPGNVIIQCDQDVDFKIIKKIIYSVGLAGYVNVHFAVTEKLEGGG
ncbi:MAG: MotA/TolQ/ExbB proton channel family protein [Pseudomonadota bacterium]